MSAMPRSMSSDDVAREHDSSSADAAPRTPFFQLVERIRNSDRCPKCHKTRTLIQLSTEHVRVSEERPDPRIHCACVGGPAYAGIGSAIAPASEPSAFPIGTRVRALRKILHRWERGTPFEWIEAGTEGTITALHGCIAAVAFDGHLQPYNHHTETLRDIVAVVNGGSQ